MSFIDRSTLANFIPSNILDALDAKTTNLVESLITTCDGEMEIYIGAAPDLPTGIHHSIAGAIITWYAAQHVTYDDDQYQRIKDRYENAIKTLKAMRSGETPTDGEKKSPEISSTQSITEMW